MRDFAAGSATKEAAWPVIHADRTRDGLVKGRPESDRQRAGTRTLAEGQPFPAWVGEIGTRGGSALNTCLSELFAVKSPNPLLLRSDGEQPERNLPQSCGAREKDSTTAPERVDETEAVRRRLGVFSWRTDSLAGHTPRHHRVKNRIDKPPAISLGELTEPRVRSLRCCSRIRQSDQHR